MISISKPELKRPLLVISLILIIAAGSFYLGQVLGSPSPSIGQIVTPGEVGQCDYVVSTDGTTPLAHLQTDTGGTPGDNIVGTAGQDFGGFVNSIVGSNRAICVASAAYSYGTTIAISGVSNISLTCASVQWSCRLKSTGTNNLIKIGSRTCTSIGTGCASQVTVSGFYIDGSSQTGGTVPESTDANLGIEVASSDGVAGPDIMISNNYIFNTGSDGIYLYAASDGTWVINNYLSSGRGYWAAIHSHAGDQKGIIMGNSILLWQAGCVRHGSIIENNWCRLSGKAGFVLNGVQTGFPCIMSGGGVGGSVIVGNWIRSCASDGISAFAGKSFSPSNGAPTISDNHIQGQSLTGYAGLNLTASSASIFSDNDLVVTSNVVESYVIGISIQNSNNSIIEQNQIVAATTPIKYIAPIGNSTIRDNTSINPGSKFTNPFGTTAWGGSTPSIAPFGTASAPSASTQYRISAMDVFITSTGGTSVSITILDSKGNTVASGLTTLTAQFLPVGYQINFGAFSPAPTVTVFGN